MKNNKENGRSMVEMLGVLAIIGVLSIGGIAGYTMAMNRYKANQILDLAGKLSVAVQTAFKNQEIGYDNSAETMALANSIAQEFGIKSQGSRGYYTYGSSAVGFGAYESTIIVSADGDIDISINAGGVSNALQSIVGRKAQKPDYDTSGHERIIIVQEK